jgi:hypothetical protein
MDRVLSIDGADALDGQVDPHPPVQQIEQDFHARLACQMAFCVTLHAPASASCVPWSAIAWAISSRTLEGLGRGGSSKGASGTIPAV